MANRLPNSDRKEENKIGYPYLGYFGTYKRVSTLLSNHPTGNHSRYFFCIATQKSSYRKASPDNPREKPIKKTSDQSRGNSFEVHGAFPTVSNGRTFSLYCRISSSKPAPDFSSESYKVQG